jgi:hypothetical protein
LPSKSKHRSTQDAAAAPASYPIKGPEERRRGEIPYLDVLKKIHTLLAPKRYLEIGVRRGTSLALAKGRAVGVDPNPIIGVELSRQTQVIKATSDRYFKCDPIKALRGKPDVVFIDGMHHFEFALRDFMNAEAISPPHGLIVMDDIYPNHPAQAERTRRTSAWTGDVWKVVEVLQKHRKDLLLFCLDTAPTGLLLVAGLDSSSDVLKKLYPTLLKTYRSDRQPPRRVLSRRDKLSPFGGELQRLLKLLKSVRERKVTSDEMQRKLRILNGKWLPLRRV